jgi:phosphatidylglycerol:prolipoprotein diacylglycerol transferase
MLQYPFTPADKIAFSIGPFHIGQWTLGPIDVHWYGIMYLLGFIAAVVLARIRAARPGSTWKPVDVEDLIFFCALGVIFGGRIGWLIVYGHETVAEDWHNVYRIWKGGMSFHGALVAVLIAMWLFAKRRGRNVTDVFDFTAPLPCLGLFFGRIGNFINGELWGKPTDLPWGFKVNNEVLHPTQLYEALLEGLVMFAVLWLYTRKPRPRLAPTGLFLLLYGVFRTAVEFVRVPDENMGDHGYVAWGWLTTGQILSVPMWIAGAALLIVAYRRKLPSGNYAASAA